MHHKNGTKHVRYRKLIGTLSKFKDKNGKTIRIGDLVLFYWDRTIWRCIFLYDRKENEFQLLRGCRHGKNIYVPESYNKMVAFVSCNVKDTYMPYCETTGETCKEELN